MMCLHLKQQAKQGQAAYHQQIGSVVSIGNSDSVSVLEIMFEHACSLVPLYILVHTHLLNITISAACLAERQWCLREGLDYQSKLLSTYVRPMH
jgi:hypothetical protein